MQIAPLGLTLPQHEQESSSNNAPQKGDFYLNSGDDHPPFPTDSRDRYISPVLEAGVYHSDTQGNRPDWISEKEAQWLDQTGGLKPVTDFSDNTVTIKLKKPGLTDEQIIDHVSPFNAYKNIGSVETSFECVDQGKRYFYTGTVVMGNFSASFTQYQIRREGSAVIIEWRQVDKNTALKILRQPENKQKLAANLRDLGLATSVEAYLDKIENNIGDLENVWGSHKYDLATGYYQYQQHVDFTDWLVKKAVNVAGEPRIIGTALKIGYLIVKEGGRAGQKGQKGKPVQAMNGATYRPDI